MSKRKLTQKQRVLRDVIAWHDWVVRERENADMWRLHARSFEAFLRDLYAIMVDPCAEGVMQLDTLMQSIKDAALRDREKWGATDKSRPTIAAPQIVMAEDGFGSVWKCVKGRTDGCGLQVVRPGKAQCEECDGTAAAASGPSEKEVRIAKLICEGSRNETVLTLARAVLRWAEQTKGVKP